MTWRRSNFFLVTMLLVFGAASLAQPHQQSVWDVATFVFRGGGGTLIQLLIPIIITVGYMYVFMLEQSAIRDGLVAPTLIRVGSFRRLIFRMIRREAIQIAGLVLYLVLLLVISYLLLGGTEFSIQASSPLLAVHFIVNGFFQLMFLAVLGFIVVWSSSSSLAIPASVAALVVISTFVSELEILLPVGRSGLQFALQGWEGVLASSFCLAAVSAALLTATLVFSNYRRPQI